MPRPAKKAPAKPARKASRKKARGQGELLQSGGSTAPAVPLIREAVAAWREGGYAGVSATTRTLLNWWFPKDGHRMRRNGGRAFRYHPFQKEAIETLIYLYEVRRLRRMSDMAATYAERMAVRPAEDRFARYVLKMATGSGKTKVMSLAIVWSYFNALNHPNFLGVSQNLTARNFGVVTSARDARIVQLGAKLIF